MTTQTTLYRVIAPNGNPCDFLDRTWREAEDNMIAEALTGSMPNRRAALSQAHIDGYKVEAVQCQTKQ